MQTYIVQVYIALHAILCIVSVHHVRTHFDQGTLVHMLGCLAPNCSPYVLHMPSFA